MFVSLEPFHGNKMFIYPNSSIDSLNFVTSSNPKFLGPDCFNATVHIDQYGMWQTTPGIRNVKKKGKRSVKKLDIGVTSTVIYKCDNMWTFSPFSPIQDSKSVDIYDSCCPCAQDFVWQWSSKNMPFHRLKDRDWITYCAEDIEKIENEYNRLLQDILKSDNLIMIDNIKCMKSNVSLQIGMKNYNVCFIIDDSNNLSTYGLQLCNQENTSQQCRYIRRAYRETNMFDVPDSEEICALCCDKFNETRHLPWLKTTCEHVFHQVCFDRIKKDKKCPICRQSL